MTPVQGSVSLLCTLYLLGGLGESEHLIGTKSWVLLKKYLVGGREEQDCARSLGL